MRSNRLYSYQDLYNFLDPHYNNYAPSGSDYYPLLIPTIILPTVPSHHGLPLFPAQTF